MKTVSKMRNMQKEVRSPKCNDIKPVIIKIQISSGQRKAEFYLSFPVLSLKEKIKESQEIFFKFTHAKKKKKNYIPKFSEASFIFMACKHEYI